MTSNYWRTEDALPKEHCPTKVKEKSKDSKETNKKKSKGNYNIYIRAAVQILQPTCFFVHDRALSAFHRQVLYMGWMFIRKTYLFSRPERRSGPYNTLGVKGTLKNEWTIRYGLPLFQVFSSSLQYILMPIFSVKQWDCRMKNYFEVICKQGLNFV